MEEGDEVEGVTGEGVKGVKEGKKERESAGDSLMDLISGGYTENTTREERVERREAEEAVEMVMVKREGKLVKVAKTAKTGR